MHRSVFAPLASLLVLASSASGQTVAPDAHWRPMEHEVATLTVNGSGEARAAPDVAEVRVGVTRQDANAQQAQEQTSQITRQILSALARLNIPKEQLQTTQLTLFPVYADEQAPQTGEPRIVGYRASNVVSIRLTDLTRIGPVMDAALKAGANGIEGVDFGLREQRPAFDQALRAAVAEARAKADAIATALGVRIVGIRSVEESSMGRPMMMKSELGGADRVSTPVSPGELTLQAGVTVHYRIQPMP